MKFRLRLAKKKQTDKRKRNNTITAGDNDVISYCM